MTEQWKDVPQYEGFYQVSDHGRVKSVRRTSVHKNGARKIVKGQLLRCSPGNHGYPCCSLYKAGNRSVWLVHRLVMLTFVGPCPEGLEVAHNDGDRTNPRLDNLRYDTRAGNSSDKKKHGTLVFGVDTHGAKLNPDAVRQIIENKDELTQQELANRYGVKFQAISSVQLGKTWAHVNCSRKTHVKKTAKGERQGRAKLSEGEVRQILQIRGTDTIKNIADRFGVSQALVSGIYAGRNWAHVSAQGVM